MKLVDKIMELAERSNHPLDQLAIDITATVAMDERERADLFAMIDYLIGQCHWNTKKVLGEVMHDLHGFMCRHEGSSGDLCFLPRSHGYAKLVSTNPAGRV